MDCEDQNKILSRDFDVQRFEWEVPRCQDGLTLRRKLMREVE
jgi:hypothetical protein